MNKRELAKLNKLIVKYRNLSTCAYDAYIDHDDLEMYSQYVIFSLIVDDLESFQL